MDLLFDPPPDALLAPFWDAFEHDRIVLPRCSTCGAFQWYPDAAGPDCEGAEYEWVEVPSSGTVHTLTRVHRAFLPVDHEQLPFTVALVDLDGVDGARLVVNLDDDSIAIGDRVRAHFEASATRRRPVFGREHPAAPAGDEEHP